MGGKRWTKEELEILEEEYPSPLMSREDLMEILPGRSDRAIEQKARRLGLSRPVPHYSEKELQYVIDNYATKGPTAVAEHLGRTAESVMTKAFFSGLVFTNGYRTNTKTFYLLFFPELNVYKVGITNNLDTRRKNLGETSEVIDSTVFETYEECISYESAALKKLEPHMEDTGILKSGNKETFRLDGSRSDLKIFLDNLI